MSDVKRTQKKGELHRHAGPLYLKDLNGCNGERKCSFIGTPIFFRLTSRTNAFRNASALTHGLRSSVFLLVHSIDTSSIRYSQPSLNKHKLTTQTHSHRIPRSYTEPLYNPPEISRHRGFRLNTGGSVPEEE